MSKNILITFRVAENAENILCRFFSWRIKNYAKQVLVYHVNFRSFTICLRRMLLGNMFLANSKAILAYFFENSFNRAHFFCDGILQIRSIDREL